MTAPELAQTLHAKRIGPGKWQAKCPAHRDRNPSLSIRQGKTAILLRCWSGCETKDVLGAVGLRMGDLFEGKPTPEIRQQLSARQKLERLQKRLGLVIVLHAIDAERRAYWSAAERGISRDIYEIYCQYGWPL